MKRFILLSLTALIALTACKKEYSIMKVFPSSKEIDVAQGSKSFIVINVEIPGTGHIYGNPKGPGTGKPTEITVKGPADIIAGRARFLKPEKFYFYGEREYTWGYSYETRMFIPVTVKENAMVGPHKIAVLFDSLLCTDPAGSGKAASCVPGIFQFNAIVRVLPRGSAGTAYNQKIIAEYGSSSAPVSDGKDAHVMMHAVTKLPDSVLPADLQFSPRFLEQAIGGIWQAILFGILAGVLLNIMPCVLPVVSLKVMSFVKHADRSRKGLFLLGLFFSLGILTSFAVLASLAAFFGYKWGGLFQHRLFLVVMTGVVFALALSMFEVYTINAPSFSESSTQKPANQYADAYLKGLLATILATPCSGPFLGGTLAWALAQRPVIIFIIFMSVGLGMALPYMVLTINPRFVKFIPKPGEWLRTFEQVMAFFLMFTVVYLLGVLDSASVLPMIAFLGFIAVGFWQFGKYGNVTRKRLERAVSAIVLVCIILAGYFISFGYLYAEDAERKAVRQEFSIHRLLENRDRGVISAVEFTADWCPNCRLVEKTALNTELVVSAFQHDSVDFMVADITSGNAPAEQLMRQFRSQTIPLLAILPAGGSFNRPIILRDIYSAHDILKALEMAREGTEKQKPEKKDGFKFQIDIKTGK